MAKAKGRGQEWELKLKIAMAIVQGVNTEDRLVGHYWPHVERRLIRYHVKDPKYGLVAKRIVVENNGVFRVDERELAKQIYRLKWVQVEKAKQRYLQDKGETYEPREKPDEHQIEQWARRMDLQLKKRGYPLSESSPFYSEINSL